MKSKVLGISISRAVLLLGFVLVLVVGIGGAISAWMLRQQSIEDWRGQMQNYALVLASQTNQTFASASLVLDGMAKVLLSSRIHVCSSQE